MAAKLLGQDWGVLAGAVATFFVGLRPEERLRDLLAYANIHLPPREGVVSPSAANLVSQIAEATIRTVDPEKLKRLQQALVDRMLTDADSAWDTVLVASVIALETVDVKVLAGIHKPMGDEIVAYGTGLHVDLVRASIARLAGLGLVDVDKNSSAAGGATKLTAQTEAARRFLAMLVDRPVAGS